MQLSHSSGFEPQHLTHKAWCMPVITASGGEGRRQSRGQAIIHKTLSIKYLKIQVMYNNQKLKA